MSPGPCDCMDPRHEGPIHPRRDALRFLARFEGRGWLHATRDDEAEQAAVDLGLRRRWLRRELGEAHFTPAGRAALQQSTAKTNP